ncbi:MAG: hypothetical protein LQ346_007783 [Caloplaca aetnensis]|nr:MAG: hypothetical protein LQ346_007783 [Caloplaca aetnensis]
MHSTTIMSIFTATMAFLATPAFGAAVGNDIAARSAELDAREAQVEARAALLVCQFGGVEACSVENLRLQPRKPCSPDPPSTHRTTGCPPNDNPVTTVVDS